MQHLAELLATGLDIRFDSPVVNIDWSNPSCLTITLSNGQQLQADAVILTVSLGVLKAKYKTLFTPELSQHKLKAMALLEIGIIDKVFVEFNDQVQPTVDCNAAEQAADSNSQLQDKRMRQQTDKANTAQQQQQQPQQPQQQHGGSNDSHGHHTVDQPPPLVPHAAHNHHHHHLQQQQHTSTAPPQDDESALQRAVGNESQQHTSIVLDGNSQGTTNNRAIVSEPVVGPRKPKPQATEAVAEHPLQAQAVAGFGAGAGEAGVDTAVAEKDLPDADAAGSSSRPVFRSYCFLFPTDPTAWGSSAAPLQPPLDRQLCDEPNMDHIVGVVGSSLASSSIVSTEDLWHLCAGVPDIDPVYTCHKQPGSSLLLLPTTASTGNIGSSARSSTTAKIGSSSRTAHQQLDQPGPVTPAAPAEILLTGTQPPVTSSVQATAPTSNSSWRHTTRDDDVACLPEWVVGLHSWRYADGPEWIKPPVNNDDDNAHDKYNAHDCSDDDDGHNDDDVNMTSQYKADADVSAHSTQEQQQASAGLQHTPATNRLETANQQPIDWRQLWSKSTWPGRDNGQSAVIWVTGRAALQLELLPDEAVVGGIHQLLHTFPAIPLPKRVNPGDSFEIYRSKWGVDPNSRGSYSYLGLGAGEDTIKALFEPMVAGSSSYGSSMNDSTDSTANPTTTAAAPTAQAVAAAVVCFAGEATSVHHMGTVHGAYMSGVREADRLLQLWGMSHDH